MELLAPAGNIENFQAALDAGADALYVGLPGMNARNLARDLQLDEIGAMISMAHALGKKVYLAANSLLLEKELPLAIETLAILQSLQPDALIVQDLAFFQLVKEYFPHFIIHASTLMTAHNSDCVGLLAELGCERVVVARELTLKEIQRISQKTDVELEVFVHGAMCYSYSGLCLFSSFLGGKSGLRGRCVQPCRRRYSWQNKQSKGGRHKGKGGSYLFSMNDLSGIEMVPPLRDAGVASLKIEGRLRSSHYITNVVSAYRKVLDAKEGDLGGATEDAKLLIENAMGRRSSPGFFLSPQPQDAIVPYHSGNVGIHAGTLSHIKKQGRDVLSKLTPKCQLQVGDRVRLHFENSGERKGFTLRVIRKNGKKVDGAKRGETVSISLPEGVGSNPGRIEIYKVDVKAEKADVSLVDIKNVQKKIRQVKKDFARPLQTILRKTTYTRSLEKDQAASTQSKKIHRPAHGYKVRKGAPFSKKLPLEFWLKTDNINSIQHRMPFTPDQFLLSMNRKMVSQAGIIKRQLGKGSRKVIWALPQVISESDLKGTVKNIRELMRAGFKSFQIGHLSQLAFFGQEKVHLYGDYTLNLLNNQAVQYVSSAEFVGVQLSIESDKNSLNELIQGYKAVQNYLKKVQRKQKFGNHVRFGLTVYGAPPLFTARLAAKHFQFDKTLVSPKGEKFFIQKKDGTTGVYPERPFSLLPYLQEIKQIGIEYMIVDLTGLSCGKRELVELDERIRGKGRYGKLPTFNYLGKIE